ncbi:MAG TPA: hypothetical protein VHG53_05205 [Candidatus Limnocylindria bacterium]|nr:hypothetical protein [Candidatus Limnocylindria bacterium]
MTGKRLALAIAAGAFTTALVGEVALGTFQPIGTDEQGRIQQIGGADQDRGPIDHLKAILDPLVAQGTISQAQEDAILQAAKNAATGARPGHARPATRGGRGLIADVIKTSGDYLGIPATDLAKALKSGESLADVAASSTTGKSRQGLIDALTLNANGRIDQAVRDKKLTAEQAAAMRSRLATEIARIVDHKGGRPPGPRGFAPGKPVPTPTPKS